jgi:alkylated DNA repair dioxygenase AlkB
MAKNKRTINAVDLLMKRHRSNLVLLDNDEATTSDPEWSTNHSSSSGQGLSKDAFSILMNSAQENDSRTLVSKIPGLSLRLKIIDNGDSIMKQIQETPGWKPVGSAENSRRIIYFGQAYNSSTASRRSSTPVPPLPEFLLPLQQIAQEATGKKLSTCLINEYLPGQGIGEHVDRTDEAGDTVVGISLGSSAMMIFRHPDGRRVDVSLPANSMYVMTGEARYVWSHQVPARIKDGNRVRTTRVSVTFRNRKVES